MRGLSESPETGRGGRRARQASEAALRVDLARRGMRLTRKRRLVLETVRSTDQHPTAEWVHRRVRDHLPRVSLATVYRNLRLLAREGLLAEFQAGPSVRFDARVMRHHHFTCAPCGRVYDLDEPVDSRLDARVAAKTGFRVSHHRMEFYGVCRTCMSRTNRRVGPDRAGPRRRRPR
jgi:Fur family peroxide stress response transcriptional regulator